MTRNNERRAWPFPFRGAMERLLGRLLDEALPERDCAAGLAVSGGADSVFLARALAALAPKRGWRLEIFHVNHGLRGEESDEDQRFVEALSGELSLPCHILYINKEELDGPPISLAAREEQGGGTSLEARLRFLRYTRLAAAARERGIAVLVTGHTCDDLAETFLLRAIRGAGLTGLGAIRPRGEWEGLPLLRPLLGIRAGEIRGALRESGFAWREDSSNRDLRFQRNRIRRKVLPVLEAREPGAIKALARTANLCAEEAAELETSGAALLAAARRLPKTVSPTPALALDWRRLAGASVVIRRHALRAFCRAAAPGTLPPSHEAILAMENACESAAVRGGERLVDSARGLISWTDGRFLLTGPAPAQLESWLAAWRTLWKIPPLYPPDMPSAGIVLEESHTPVSLKYPLEDGCLRLRFANVKAETIENLVSKARASSDRQFAVFDAGAIHPPLFLQSAPRDERIPLPRLGHKSVEKCLAERRIPILLRSRIACLADAQGVLWIPGIARSSRAPLTSASRIALIARVGR